MSGSSAFRRTTSHPLQLPATLAFMADQSQLLKTEGNTDAVVKISALLRPASWWILSKTCERDQFCDVKKNPLGVD
ncbi:hypothetical protein Mapa_017066 [Marchantia paleacea]|nr:hypothetical protein Mapa_017066 [Marchantia paleacea]